MSQSILDDTAFQETLERAKENLKRNGAVAPVIILLTDKGERILVQIDLPGSAYERQKQLTNLGFLLAGKGIVVDEAVMIIETWIVSSKAEKDLLKVVPSQHPQRKEAIVLVGRNASKSRSGMLIQPFTRGIKGEPVWEKVEAFMPKGSPKTSDGNFQGLIDYMFVQDRIKHIA